MRGADRFRDETLTFHHLQKRHVKHQRRAEETAEEGGEETAEEREGRERADVTQEK